MYVFCTYEVTVRGLALGLSDSEQGSIMRFCEHGNEPCDSRKGKQFVDQIIG